jgi:putative molybdopterin biosynthesis protein
MKYNYLNNIPLDEAVKKYSSALTAAGLSCKTEIIQSADSFGRITAHAVYAKICSPHYNASAMDGIALDAQCTFGASELTPVSLSPCDFAVVDTGDPLPEGADCVVMVEDVVEAQDGCVLLQSAAVPWQNVRQIGEDICEGDMLMPSYTEITPAMAGALLAGGNLEIEVLRRPVVGIIPTGDEIVPPTAQPKSGDIVEFNSVIFTGMLKQWGAQPKTYPITPDKLALIEQAIISAAAECDIVLIIAGSSAGREDYTAQAITNTGTLVLHGIAIKPGKPAVLGHLGAVACIGVPGYSVSAILVMEKIVRPVVDRLLCRDSGDGSSVLSKYEETEEPSPCLDEETEEPSPCLDAVLSKKIASSLKYREFVRARLSYADGKLTAIPLNRGAGVITSFTNAHGIIDIPQNCEGYESGEIVQVQLLKSIRQIKNLLVVTGSHDPLIDEAADIFKRSGSGREISSSHMGSMGAVMAVKSRQAHIGGIHLLDEAGEYNLSYLKTYFPEGGITLIEGVSRAQGLMTPAGNPKELKDFADIANTGISYVNRQRGSGTRILCDFLAQQNGIEPGKIYGYNREEFTHTAVAALIKAGSADTGLGIYSAAKIYGLHFVPVTAERYDFICRTESLENDGVKEFLRILQSADFRSRMEELGGYTINKPGTIKAQI